jgi:hypothetical protein
MKLSISSPMKYFIGRQAFGPRRTTIRQVARYSLYAAFLGCALSACGTLSAQQSSTAVSLYSVSSADDDSQATQKSVPDAPAPQSTPADQPAPQTRRILGIIPNFRAISTDVKLPPQSIKEKFMDATQDSFDYSSIVLPGLLAAYSMGTDATPEFHQGAAGYARYFWHAAVDQTSENYMVNSWYPSSRMKTRGTTRWAGEGS